MARERVLTARDTTHSLSNTLHLLGARAYLASMLKDQPVLMTAAEVAVLLKVSQGRVAEILPPTIRLSPRRARWAREAVLAVVEGRQPPANMNHRILKALWEQGPLTDRDVARFLRCQVAVVGYLPLPQSGGTIDPSDFSAFLEERM